MDELNLFAEKFSSENSIQNYDVHIESYVGKGENYLGEVLFFNITPRNGGEPIHFVRKKAKYVKGSKEEAVVRSVYKREAFMYQVVFPEMKNFLEKYNDNVALNYIPKVYYIVEEEDREMLIFQNMKYEGYQLLNRKKLQDHERIRGVLKTLAKFHAISFAMKNSEPETFKDMTENLVDVWKNFKCLIDANEYFGKLLKDALDKLEGREDLVPKFRPIFDDLENVVYVEVEEEDQLVICHGDSWMNNMLFRTDDKKSGQPEVCLIDFQISNLSSPALDLSIFLLSSGDKYILSNIEEYLRLYHDYLSDSLKNFDIDTNDVFPYKKLMEHWRKYAKTGFIVAVSSIKSSLSEAEEVADDLNSVTHTASSKMKNADIFTERITNLLVCFAEKFL